MINRHYFETVVTEQLEIMERPARLTVHLSTGQEYGVRGLIAAHDEFVVLAVYGEGKDVQHTKSWQKQNSEQDPIVYDQVAVPYALIAFTHLNPRSTKGDDARTVTGFRPE